MNRLRAINAWLWSPLLRLYDWYRIWRAMQALSQLREEYEATLSQWEAYRVRAIQTMEKTEEFLREHRARA